MRAPAFWGEEAPGLAASLLSPAGAIYGAVVARRMARPGAASGVPVICVGNFTAGGAGKTPLAIAVAEMLIARGEAPAFLSRGHGGSHRGSPLRVDPARHEASVTGDEPLLLARVAPTFVCSDRFAGARAAVAAGASVLVMDDGMQNPSLRKDFTLVAVDGGAGVGNGLCMPAGPLRAPLAAQLPRVDALAIIGAGEPGERVAASAPGKPVFHARLAPDPAIAARLRGARVVAFAGIGRPEKFFDTLRETGAEVVATRAFADHHPFTPNEIATLKREAAEARARLVTTEKDFTRLPADCDALALPARLEFPEAEKLAALLGAALVVARGKPGSGPG